MKIKKFLAGISAGIDNWLSEQTKQRKTRLRASHLEDVTKEAENNFRISRVQLSNERVDVILYGGTIVYVDAMESDATITDNLQYLKELYIKQKMDKYDGED